MQVIEYIFEKLFNFSMIVLNNIYIFVPVSL